MLVAALVILALAITLYLFVGWLVRAFIFCAFWVLAHWWLLLNVPWTKQVAFTFGTDTTVSWAAVLPSIVCFLCLMFSKE